MFSKIQLFLLFCRSLFIFYNFTNCGAQNWKKKPSWDFSGTEQKNCLWSVYLFMPFCMVYVFLQQSGILDSHFASHLDWHLTTPFFCGIIMLSYYFPIPDINIFESVTLVNYYNLLITLVIIFAHSFALANTVSVNLLMTEQSISKN